MSKPTRSNTTGRRRSAQVITLPVRDGGSLDVRGALVDNQSSPTLLLPKDVQEMVDTRARELAEEAYQLCRQHLMRRIAHSCEYDQPRQLDIGRAREVLREGNLGHALVRVWHTEMVYISRYANTAVLASARFAEDMRKAMEGLQVNRS